MFVLQTTENSEKRVVEIQQTKLYSHYKQIKTSECWKLWQEGSKSNAANYFLCVENYIFWKSSSQNAHPLDLWLMSLMTLSRTSASRFTEASGRHLFIMYWDTEDELLDSIYFSSVSVAKSEHKYIVMTWHKTNIKRWFTVSLKGTLRLQYSLERAMRKKSIILLVAYLLLIAKVECEQTVKDKGNLILFLLSSTSHLFQLCVLRHRTPVTTGGIVVMKIMIHNSITRGLKLTKLIMLTLFSSMETSHWQKHWMTVSNKHFKPVLVCCGFFWRQKQASC